MASKNYWQLDFRGLRELEEKMKQIPGRSEVAINDVLHNKGIPITIEAIQPDIPVSTWKNRVRDKKHARDTKNPQAAEKQNLAFTIRPKPRFNYLKYPDLGIGQSQHNPPQHFMNKGLKKAAPKIIEELNKRIDEEIKKTLGG